MKNAGGERTGRSRRYRRSRRKRGWRRLLGPGVAIFLLALAVGSWLSPNFRVRQGGTPAAVGSGDPASASAGAYGSAVTLPEDDGPHEDYMEWWYYNSHLRAADGRVFSFHYVFFLIDSVVTYTVAQISLTDHQTGKHYTAQQESAGNPSAGAEKGFDFVLGDWVMSGSNGHDRIKVITRDFAFDLTSTSAGPVLYHGGTGLLVLGNAGSSFYYSRPRMNLEGRLTLGGKMVPVTGQSWFDHQWGDFRVGELTWDWFALQLDDGADIMLYRIRDRMGQGVVQSGTYSRNESTEILKEGDFQVESTRTWRSKTTGVSYPVAWNVRIPGQKVDIRVKPVAEDSEIDARTTTYNTYWEGAVTLEGSHRGRGFLEISPGGPRRSETGQK